MVRGLLEILVFYLFMTTLAFFLIVYGYASKIAVFSFTGAIMLFFLSAYVFYIGLPFEVSSTATETSNTVTQIVYDFNFMNANSNTGGQLAVGSGLIFFALAIFVLVSTVLMIYQRGR
jgi:hypothetical protein